MKVYPKNIKKYSGNIIEINRGWQYRLLKKNRRESKLFKKYDDAVRYLKYKSNIYNYTKNIVHECIDEFGKKYYEVELTQGKKTKIDISDLSYIENNTWYARYDKKYDKYYAIASVERRAIFLHNIILDKKVDYKGFVKHINGDTLDNRRENLTIMSRNGDILIETIKNTDINYEYEKIYEIIKNSDNLDFLYGFNHDENIL